MAHGHEVRLTRVPKPRSDVLCAHSGRSGGVAVTGSSGGTGYIASGAEQTRQTDWGIDCVDCPKGGSLKFKAVDGKPWGNGDWGVESIKLFGCTKSDSKHNGGGLNGWSHDLHNMRNMNCPARYQDEGTHGSQCLLRSIGQL